MEKSDVSLVFCLYHYSRSFIVRKVLMLAVAAWKGLAMKMLSQHLRCWMPLLRIFKLSLTSSLL